MKCEICHQADAETVLLRGEGETEEELYVCKACAKAERQRRQKKSQRTRKVTGLPPGVSMSITRIGPIEDDGDEPPPFIKAIMDAMSGMVDGSEKPSKGSTGGKDGKPASAPAVKRQSFPVARVEAPFRLRDRLHLEGLHLIGELAAVRRALHALDMELVGVEADGVHEPGHVYGIDYAGSATRAKRVVEDILREGQLAGEIRDDAPADLIAEMFHSVYQAAAFSKLPIGFQENVALKTRLLLAGIRKA